MTPLQARFDVFCTEPIGCILLVTQYINSANASAPDPPVISLIAAPSMATIGPITQEDPPGLLYADLWEAMVLAPFATHLNIEEPHCLVLGECVDPSEIKACTEQKGKLPMPRPRSLSSVIW
jgi:hypothetical protein